MASINSSQPNNNTNPVMERAAVIPITGDQVLNEVLRKLIIPNLDEKIVFYKGIVTGILDDNNPDYRVNDIFYDFGAEQDRSSDTNSSNNDKKILSVHVPSFTTSDKVSSETINYDNFNKIKIVYTGKDPIQVGNIVLLEFQNKNNFLNPIVKQIIQIENSFEPENSKISSLIFDESPYNFLNISPPDQTEQINREEITLPRGGYESGLQAIEKIFQADFLSFFINGLDNKIFGDLSKISIKLDKLSAKQELLNFINSNISSNKLVIIPDDSVSKEEFLIYGYTNITCDNPGNVESLTYNFLRYAKQYLINSYWFALNILDTKKGEFSLDVKLNEVNNTSKSLKNYLDVELMGYNKNFITQKIPTKISPSIITSNEGI